MPGAVRSEIASRAPSDLERYAAPSPLLPLLTRIPASLRDRLLARRFGLGGAAVR